MSHAMHSLSKIKRKSMKNKEMSCLTINIFILTLNMSLREIYLCHPKMLSNVHHLRCVLTCESQSDVNIANQNL